MKKFLATFVLMVTFATMGFISASAQSLTSGDIAGTVTDSTGAVVGKATVTATNADNGAKKAVTTSPSGSYRLSLLPPGRYHLSVVATGFNTATVDVQVGAGTVAQGDAKLQIGSASTTVEVTEETPLLRTESAEITTEFTQEQIANLPNPGNDLTFIAQTAPGAVMNTQGGYGNFATFGLPATANTFTVNGAYENDPFLNVNNSGATNLLLGNNDIGTVTVLSNAYGAQYGGLGGTQVNENTRSGSNHFHGDATYFWNGSVMNANDYFNNQSGTPKPRSNANQWSGAIGGPIFKDKTFFFFNTEGLRVIIPVRGTVYAPSASFVATAEANAAAQSPSNLAFIKNYFLSYQTSPQYLAALANPADADANDPNDIIYNANSANFAHEAQYTFRIDQHISDKDTLFVHATIDRGVQPTFTSLLNPVFNASSPQPEYGGQLYETHSFSPNITNQFVFAELYYKAIFQNTNVAAANILSPFSVIFIGGDMANNGLGETPGGEDFVWPQGRDVNGYQFIDDISINHGKHTLKAGFYLRRDDVTDYGPGVYTTPAYLETESDLINGNATQLYGQQFPLRLTQPVSVYNMGMYVQDEWKATKELIITAGLRLEHNSDPVCHTSCFSSLANSFTSLPTSLSTPYNNNNGNGLINSGLNKAFANFQKVAYEPRFGFNYTPVALKSTTSFSGGFGMFADAFPAQVADSLLNNSPTNVGYSFIPGPYPLNPAAPGSFTSVLAASTTAFRSGFASGGSNTSLSSSDPNFASPGFVSTTPHVSYPTYEEWNLQVQHQLNKTTTVSVDYVGNHTYHQPVLNNSVNAYNGGAPGFPTLPTAPLNSNFSGVTQIYSGAVSNYNGVVLSAQKRSTWLTLQFNYTYSHALDEVSNGGFDGFSGNSVNPTNPNPAKLRQNYGNADYDTRNYVSANYILSLPYWGGPKALTKGWQIAGTVFHSSGLPFTFTDSSTSGNDFGNYGGPLFAKQTVAHIPTKCSGNGATNGASAVPCAAAGDIATATDFGQQERNQVFGPSYTDTDMSVYKSFNLPHYQSAHLKLGVQFFNLLNHPNFGQPLHDTSDGSAMGTIVSTVNPPTSILGSFLGGDASPRLIQLKANINF